MDSTPDPSRSDSKLDRADVRSSSSSAVVGPLKLAPMEDEGAAAVDVVEIHLFAVRLWERRAVCPLRHESLPCKPSDQRPVGAGVVAAAVVVAGYCAAGLAGCRTEGCISLLGRGSLVVLTDVVVVVELAAVVAV